MRKPPEIKLTPISSKEDAKPFIKVERNLCKIEYPSGKVREMIVDSVARKNPDAAVIIPWTKIDGEIHVWLRSCIRPAAAIRNAKDPNFEYNGNFWELPAGIVDPGETPAQAAKRECLEEAGFDCELDKFIHIQTILSMPALLAERLYFYTVFVNNNEQVQPTLDGSPLEEGGELCCIPLSDIERELKCGMISDMKTNLGIRMFREI